MRQRRVIYTPDATTDLEWIYDTIATARSPLVASRYEQRIRDFCQRLEYGAERGTSRADIRPGLQVVGFERRVTVAIVAEDDRVVILRIFYGGRDWANDFP
ncbi:type II toxin-antitoxin system RelE/ParE family toxin [Bosea sp. (in: a-proteobacteria)]|uniref:type II toxin-antitoxin system RelE/ParE family toxin n=1 Tax=Bosea sp. (in: a-proteobacteria) TaxID=1871050 RepID=UPI003B3A66C5